MGSGLSDDPATEARIDGDFERRRPDGQRDWICGRYHALWGGEVAADRLLHYLEPQTATIYAHDTAKRLIAEQRLRADATGDVEILDVFWNTDQVPAVDDLVPRFSLMPISPGPPTEETSKRQDDYERLLEPALRNEL